MNCFVFGKLITNFKNYNEFHYILYNYTTAIMVFISRFFKIRVNQNL